MNILIISNKLPYPPKDGGSIATFTLALNLADFAKSVDILAINTSKHFFDIKKIPAEITQKIKFYDFYLNTDLSVLKLIQNLLFSKLPYNAERFINKDFADKIIEILNSKNYDVVQLEGLYVLPYIEIIRKNSSAKISYRAHNIEHEIWRRTLAQTKNVIKNYYIKILFIRLKKFEESFINSYDLIVPITERDEKKLSEMGNIKPSITIPTGINIENYRYDDNLTDKNSIFHIGALDWSPNQEGLIWFIDNCWQILQKQNPEIKFYIAGRNAPKWFENYLNRKNIIFLGEVENAMEFVNSKFLMVVPLLSGSGMRIKIIEAMAMAKPVISTSIGVEGINVVDNQNILIADNKDDFISKISDVLKNTENAENIGKQARIFIANFYNNVSIAKKLYDFYK